MLRFDPSLKVYLHRDAVDFRKSINGLVALVEGALGLDPYAEAIYVFRNGRRDRIKLLCWDRSGFWLLLKRLEEDRFVWPREAELMSLTVEQLQWLLQGVDIAALSGHARRHYRLAGSAPTKVPGTTVKDDF
jgi:transposase